jgi:hypothetical protein
MRTKSAARWLLLLIVPMVLLAGCALAGAGVIEPDVPIVTEPQPAQEAMVEEVSILILESWPVQIRVLASGYLSDAVTEIGDVQTTVDGDTILIRIYTTRDPEAMGAQVLTPFELSIPLDYAELGLEPGTYTVDVNGVQETLVLDANMMGADATEPQMGLAIVEEVTIVVETSPAEVNVVASGYLNDAATELDIVEITMEGDVIAIRIYTTRDPEVMAAQVLVPFELSTPLGLAHLGLEPGTYTVDVNGVQETLLIDASMIGD